MSEGNRSKLWDLFIEKWHCDTVIILKIQIGAVQQLLFSFCSQKLVRVQCLHQAQGSEHPRAVTTSLFHCYRLLWLGLRYGLDWCHKHFDTTLAYCCHHALVTLNDGSCQGRNYWNEMAKFQSLKRIHRREGASNLSIKTNIPVSHHFCILPCMHIYLQDLISSHCTIEHIGLPTTSYFFFGEQTVQNQPDNNKQIKKQPSRSLHHVYPHWRSCSFLILLTAAVTAVQQLHTWEKDASDIPNSSDSTRAWLWR